MNKQNGGIAHAQHFVTSKAAAGQRPADSFLRKKTFQIQTTNAGCFSFLKLQNVPIHFLLFPFYYKAVEFRKSFVSRTVEKHRHFDL